MRGAWHLTFPAQAPVDDLVFAMIGIDGGGNASSAGSSGVAGTINGRWAYPLFVVEGH